MSSLPAYAQGAEAQLDGYVGQHIRQICPNGYENDHDNHCAHFVSHVLGLSYGTTCRSMTGKGTVGASIRVHELFARCLSVGAWADFPSPVIRCLAFVTKSSNVNLATKIMTNVPRKHVGIYYFGTIYHYKNAIHQVVRYTPDQFRHHYSDPGTEIYWGTI